MNSLRSFANRLRNALGSMRVRVLVACFCAALIASVVSAGITYNAAAAVIRRNALDQVTQLLGDADERMGQAVAEMEEVALFLAVDQALVEALTDSARPVSFAWYEQWKAAQQALGQFMTHRPNIARIDLIGRDKAFSSDSLMLLSEMRRQFQHKPALETIDQQWRFDMDGDASMVYVRGVYQGRARVGTVLICLDKARLAELYRPQLYPDGFLFVLSPDGDVLYGSEKGITNIRETRFAEAFEAGAPEGVVSIEGSAYLVRRTASARTGLVTLALISDQALIRDSIHLRRQSTVMLAVLLLLSLGGAYLVSRRISANLRRLGKAMQKVEEGDLSVSLKLRGHDEVARLGEGFQTMMETIQSLFAKVADQERARHQAELRALQAQIGPHFMCNALSSIKYLAILQDAKNIEEMSGALAEMVRVLLGSLEEEITIREELQLLESYVLLQKYRLLDSIQVDFDVEEAALDARLPKLLLQPILENAYLHGMANRESGRISVRIAREGNRVCCEISDNGNGMTQEQIERMLREGPEERRRQLTGLGLRNVRDRVRMQWPECGSLTIESEPGRYTRVRIALPYRCEARKEEAHAAHCAGG